MLHSEAASVAWHPLGWRAVAFSEIEKFPSAVLKHHYPDVPNLGDFTKIDGSTLGRVDILAGGTPCQAFSVAGLRQSLADARGNLSLEFVRLAHELADRNGLRNAVWENVVGVLSTKDNAFGCFLAGLVGADSAIEPPTRGKWPRHGMVSGPKGRAAWAVKDAQFFGVAQRRRRVIVVADFGNGADPAAVLFEPEGVFRHSPPSRETGKGTAADVAPSLVSSGRGVERTGDTRGQDPVVAVFDRQSSAEYGMKDIASTVGARDYKSPSDLVAVGVHGDISHTLKAEGADASEDGTGRGTPIIAFSAKDYGADASVELAPTLRSGNHSESHANGGVMPAICFAHQAGGDGTSSGAFSEELSPTLQKSQTMAVSVAIRGREGGATAELGGDVATALRASQGGGDKPHVLTSAVRRLTPKECERLQGFPDSYTAIPWRGKPADQCPDGPRYKALGNSWAVPKFNWLGKRIAALMPDIVANDNLQADKEAA